MGTLQISCSETESKLREANKILREHLEDQKYAFELQKELIEHLENEIIDLKLSNKVETKKTLRPKHLKIV